MPSGLTSFRSVMIPVLLMATLAACDRQVSGNEQAAAPAPTAIAPSPASPPAPAETGTIDRSHKGAVAPTTSFEGPDGKPTTLAAFRGKPVLVNLWATWCGPCVKELPTLDAAAAGIAVVPISQDLERGAVTAFFAKHHFARLQPYLDPKTGFSVAYNATLPMSILLDSTGHEVWRSTGGMDWSGAPARALLAEAR